MTPTEHCEEINRHIAKRCEALQTTDPHGIAWSLDEARGRAIIRWERTGRQLILYGTLRPYLTGGDNGRLIEGGTFEWLENSPSDRIPQQRKRRPLARVTTADIDALLGWS